MSTNEGRLASEREAQMDGEEIARCHVCAQVFETQEQLSKHLIESHEELAPPASGSR